LRVRVLAQPVAGFAISTIFGWVWAMRVTLDVWMGIDGEEGSQGRPPLRSKMEAETEEGITGGEFMAIMATRRPVLGQRVFDTESGHFRPNILVVLNDRVITAAQAREVVLEDGDTIAVFPLDAGG
jgi:molybdopterin converting factor small subunit